MLDLESPAGIAVSIVAAAFSAGGVYVGFRAQIAALKKEIGVLQAAVNDGIRSVRIAGEESHKREIDALKENQARAKEAWDLNSRVATLERNNDDRVHSFDRLEATIDRQIKMMGDVRERLAKTRTYSQGEMPAARDSRSELPSSEPPPMRPRLPTIPRR